RGLDLLFPLRLAGLRVILLDDVGLRRLGGELVADLGLVTVLVFVRPAAEEDAAVEVLAVADALQLQREVAPRALCLQITGAVLDVDPALGRNGEFRPGSRCVALILLPAREVLAVEDRLQTERPELDIAKGEAALRRYLQADGRCSTGAVDLHGFRHLP